MSRSRFLHSIEALKCEVDQLFSMSKASWHLSEVRKRRADIRNILLGRVVLAHKPLRWGKSEEDGLRQMTSSRVDRQYVLGYLSEIDKRLQNSKPEVA